MEVRSLLSASKEIIDDIYSKKNHMSNETNSDYYTEQRRRQKWFRLNLLLITPGVAFAIFGIGSRGFFWWTLPSWLFLICLNIWTWLQTSKKQ